MEDRHGRMKYLRINGERIVIPVLPRFSKERTWPCSYNRAGELDRLALHAKILAARAWRQGDLPFVPFVHNHIIDTIEGLNCIREVLNEM
jgi:hypothetical protein